MFVQVSKFGSDFFFSHICLFNCELLCRSRGLLSMARLFSKTGSGSAYRRQCWNGLNLHVRYMALKCTLAITANDELSNAWRNEHPVSQGFHHRPGSMWIWCPSEWEIKTLGVPIILWPNIPNWIRWQWWGLTSQKAAWLLAIDWSLCTAQGGVMLKSPSNIFQLKVVQFPAVTSDATP